MCLFSFENYTANVMVDQTPVFLGLWDTSGQEDYDRLRPLSYAGADIFLICFAIDCMPSFESVRLKWFPEVRSYLKEVPIVLVGTKVDLRKQPVGSSGSTGAIASSSNTNLTTSHQQQVTSQQGIKMAKDIGAAAYVECSALTQQGLREVFEEAIRTVISASITSKRSKRVKPLRHSLLNSSSNGYPLVMPSSVERNPCCACCCPKKNQ